MAGPTPPATAPYTGPSSQAPKITTASPRFMYPPVGEGTCKTMVPTQPRAANSPVRASSRASIRPVSRFKIFSIAPFSFVG